LDENIKQRRSRKSEIGDAIMGLGNGGESDTEFFLLVCSNKEIC
jgi:hypothetical protein